MFPKRLLAIGLFAAAIFMHAGLSRAQWVQVMGTGPQHGYELKGYAAEGSLLVAAYDQGGLFFSRDGGVNWTQLNRGLPLQPNFESVGIHDSTLYVSLWYQSSSITGKFGVFVSSDFGESWRDLNSPFGDLPVLDFASLDSCFFAATENGLYETLDGQRWSAVQIPSHSVTSMASSSGSLFLGTKEFGVVCSTDQGKVWSLFDDGYPKWDTVVALAWDSSYLFAIVGNSLFRADQTKGIWEKVGQWITSLAPCGPDILANSINGVELSTDWGATWNSSGLSNAISIYGFVAGGGHLVASTDHGLYIYSSDSETWSQIRRPQESVDISFLQSGDSLFLAAQDGLFFSIDTGQSWTKLQVPFNQAFMRRLTKAGPAILTGTYTGVFRSTDNCESWVQTSNFDGEEFALQDGEVFAGGVNGVFRSDDNGETWTSASEGLGGDTNIWALAVMDSSILAATYGGGMFASTDRGTSWVHVGSGEMDSIPIMSLLLQNGKLFAGFWLHGIYESSNGGATWQEADSGRTAGEVETLADAGGTIFVGGYRDIYGSSDLGGTWSAQDSGYTALSAVGTLINFGNYLIAGTEGAGVWRRPLSDFGISAVLQSPAAMPEIQSYPNPFSQSTTISFTSEVQGYADVRIVNLLGAEVAHLYSGELAAGEHSFVWSNPTGLPAGMYECVVRMDGIVEHAPILLEP